MRHGFALNILNLLGISYLSDIKLKAPGQIFIIFNFSAFRRKKAKIEDSRYEIQLDPARTDVGVAKFVRDEETSSNVIMFKDTLEFDLSSNNQVA